MARDTSGKADFRRITGVIAITIAASVGAACDGTWDGPVGPDVALKKGPPGGGGGPGGGGLAIAFVDPVSLGGSAVADYLAASQQVSGSNGRNSLQAGGPYTLTLDLSDEIQAKRALPEPECTEAVFDVLGLASGPVVFSSGDIGVNVDKRAIKRNGTFSGGVYTYSNGIVVNYTVSVGGSEYFLTVGTSGNGSNHMSADESSFSKTGGFLRINTDGQIGPICDGIVDLEFTAN